MQRIERPEEFQKTLAQLRAAGKSVGLVPTMGALHEGHESLMQASQERCDTTAVTIFVNPLQFRAGEDLDRYPRTLAADLERCEKRGVAVVFTPTNEAMYPPGFQTTVSLSALTQPLEGAFRPGHFDGVTTVVAKLFALAGPCSAFFGRKDYQQWKIIERMARDLCMPVEVVGCPIVRESDGLAMSSRNHYLSPEERQRALGIVKGIRAAHAAWQSSERNPDALSAVATALIKKSFDRIDYVAAVDPETLLAATPHTDRLLLVVAAHLGGTRLIDNIVLGEDRQP